MEDSLNRKYINISNKPFSHKVYNDEDQRMFSYKPTSGFWLSLESSDDEYYSEWDEEYRETFQPDDNGNLHATVVKFKPTTYVMSPAQDKTILEGFNNFIAGKNLSPDQKRKLLVELLKRRTNRQDIENVICQIDLLEDISAIEEIFGGYKFGEEHEDSVYENLADNVKKGIRESFAGFEVTGFALGVDDECAGESISDTQAYWSFVDPQYQETIDYFEIPSVAVFDTSCLDVVKEIVYPQAGKEKEEQDDREDK